MKNAATRRGNNLVLISITFRLLANYPGTREIDSISGFNLSSNRENDYIVYVEWSWSTNRASSTIAAAFSLQGKREFARLMRTINASVPVEGCLRSVERLLLLKNV